MRALPYLLATLLLAACSSTTPSPDDASGGLTLFRGGSRLKARVLSGEGGAKVFQSFSDSALGTDCAPRQGADGKLRCLPLVGGDPLFADAACTLLAARAPAECEPSKFTATADSCGKGVEVYEIGAKLEGPKAYRKSNGACEAFSPDAPLHATTKVDLAKFAELTTSEVAAGPLTVTQVRSADGAAAVYQLAITSSKAECALQSLSDVSGEALGCVPAAASSTPESEFGDAACSEPVAVSYQSEACGARPAVAQIFAKKGAGECDGYRLEYRALGEPVSALYAKGGGTCAALPAPPGAARSAYKLGATVDPATFPAVASRSVGSGRLRSREYTVADKAVGQAQTLLDGEVACSPSSFADGVKRCLPGTVRTVTARETQQKFADPACTQPLYEQDLCSAPATHIAIVEETGCKRSITKVLKAGAKFTGTKFYFSNPGDSACLPADVSPRSSLFSAGEEVSPAAAFATVTEALE
ncbi:MAG: hypothetical protein IPF92_30870 [Myxococcales bacterium]|nr:hypothetical protein [Myxococcales bacterium]MBL0195621.1 hypothetical protein [Myxococcales bacterium]HQY63371.1 hypothetical protein [Polyangiaceae bacterium]